MHVEQKHNLGKVEAIRRIDAMMEEAMRKGPPAGVVVTDFSKTWSADTLRLSLTAKKGFFGVNIAAAAQVTDELVTVDADLPGLLTAFVSEEKIRGDLQKQIQQILAAG
ncbi:MAG: polyhydroxyalkanoic acid system family protein [Verrucomicrobiae bacterium]|nr:polyhydroxyalkanoic acid system family protein [Verrucomicrobiae bacterium]